MKNINYYQHLISNGLSTACSSQFVLLTQNVRKQKKTRSYNQLLIQNFSKKMNLEQIINTPTTVHYYQRDGNHFGDQRQLSPPTKLEQKTQNFFQPHLLKKNAMHGLTDEPFDLQQNNKEYLEINQSQIQQNIRINEQEQFNANKMYQRQQDQQEKQNSIDKKQIGKKRTRKQKKILYQENQFQNVFDFQKQQIQLNQPQQKKLDEPKSIQQLIKKKKTEMKEQNKCEISLEDRLFVCKGFQAKKNAVYAPLKINEQSYCYLKRYGSGIGQSFQAVGQQGSGLLFCQNQRGAIGCNYYISLTKEMDKNHPSYLGKLRGNALGSVYMLYDSGLQPDSDIPKEKWRGTHAYIAYQTNFLGMNGPRRVYATCSQLNANLNKFKVNNEEEFLALQDNLLLRFKNKKPVWNEAMNCYALHFGGRVKLASIKNFILVNQTDSEDKSSLNSNVIKFGKVDQSTFVLQFTYPLSLFQAFGIAVSQFDFKIRCE